MQTFKLLIAALLTVAGLSAAHAADLPMKGDDSLPAIVRIETSRGFGGWFVGGSVNWDNLNVEQRGSLTYPAIVQGEDGPELGTASTGFVGLPDADGSEISFGARFGYLFQIGRLYGGPVAMFDLGGPSAKFNYSDGAFDGSIETTVNWKASLVGKLGVQVLDRVGVYAIAGVAFVDMDVDGKAHYGTPGQGFGLTTNHNETVTALTYGVGVDLKISDGWTGFAEYQRFDLDTFNASGSIFADQIQYGYKGDSTIDTVRVGMTYSFN